MPSTVVTPFEAAAPVGARHHPGDLAHGVRDALREVADRFASRSARLRGGRWTRTATRLPSGGSVLRNLGDAFALPVTGRFA